MVRILVASRRPCEAEAFATSSYEMNFDQPLSAETLVSAAVRVVLPWSTWPMVPTLTCGLVRSNRFFATLLLLLYARTTGLSRAGLRDSAPPRRGGGAGGRMRQPTRRIELLTSFLPRMCSTD